MGTDNLHHRRKARKKESLKRKKPAREPYQKVLIVTEGEKTEPLYFEELRQCWKLNSANIVITGDSASSPRNVVEFAKNRYRESDRTGDPYDRVFCVFDKDSHATYQSALESMRVAKPTGVFEAITSVPCFEYWLLLHFVYSCKPYQATGKKSSCDCVLSELKDYLPDYEKGRGGLFVELESQLSQAIAYSERSLKAAESTGTDNPSTKIHLLVDFLRNINKV